jgi:hypothetical protein
MQFKLGGAILLSIVTITALTGCGSGPPAVEQPSASAVADMQALRGIFDSVQGDYSKLSADQKKKFLDYSQGDQAKVDHLWAFMKNPRGGGITSEQNQPFKAGPGGQVSGPKGAAGGPGANR